MKTNKKIANVSFWKNEKRNSNKVTFIEPVKTKINKLPSSKINFLTKNVRKPTKVKLGSTNIFVPKVVHSTSLQTMIPKNKNFAPKNVTFFPLKKQPQEFFKIPKDAHQTITKNIPKKNMNWMQARDKYPHLNPWGDADKDGVINMLDCKPFNKNKQDITDSEWQRIKRNIENLYREKGADVRTLDLEALKDSTLTYEELNRELMEYARQQLGTSAGEQADFLGGKDSFGYQVKTPLGLFKRNEITLSDLRTAQNEQITSKTRGDELVREARKLMKSLGQDPNSIDFKSLVNQDWSPIENKVYLEEQINKKLSDITTNLLGPIPKMPSPNTEFNLAVSGAYDDIINQPDVDTTKPPIEMPNKMLRGEPQPFIPEAQENVEAARYLSGEYNLGPDVDLSKPPYEPTESEMVAAMGPRAETPLSKNQLNRVITDVKRFAEEEYKGVINVNSIDWDKYTKNSKTLAEADDSAMKAIDDYLANLEKEAKEIRRTKSRPEGITALRDISEKPMTKEKLREAFEREREEALREEGVKKQKPGRPKKAVMTPEDIERRFGRLDNIGTRIRAPGESEFAIPSIASLAGKTTTQLDKERTKIIGQKAALESELKYTQKLQRDAGKTAGTIERIREKSEDIAALESTIDNYNQAIRMVRSQTKPISYKSPGRPKKEKIKELKPYKIKVSAFGGIEVPKFQESPSWILKEALVTPEELKEVSKRTKTPEERGRAVRTVEFKKLGQYMEQKIPEYKQRIEESKEEIDVTQAMLVRLQEELNKDVANRSITRENAKEILAREIDKAKQKTALAKGRIKVAEEAISDLVLAPARLPLDIRRTIPEVPRLTYKEINAMEIAAEKREREKERDLKEFEKKIYESKVSPEFREENLWKLKPLTKVKFVAPAPGAEARADVRSLAMSVPEYAKKTKIDVLYPTEKIQYPKERKMKESAEKLLKETPEWTFMDTVKDTLGKFKPKRGKGGVIENMPPVTLTAKEEREMEDRRMEKELGEGMTTQELIEDLPKFEERESKRKEREEKIMEKQNKKAEREAISGEAYTAKEISEGEKSVEQLVEEVNAESKAERESLKGMKGEEMTSAESILDIPEPTDYSTSESSMGAEAILDEISREDNKYDTSKEEKK